MDLNIPLNGSGLLARLPEKPLLLKGTGLPALDPCGVPLCGVIEEGLSFNFLIFPLSPTSPPDPAPPSRSLAEPAPPSCIWRTRFLLTCVCIRDEITQAIKSCTHRSHRGRSRHGKRCRLRGLERILALTLLARGIGATRI